MSSVSHFLEGDREVLSALNSLTGCWSKWEGHRSFLRPGKDGPLVFKLGTSIVQHIQTAPAVVSSGHSPEFVKMENDG